MECYPLPVTDNEDDEEPEEHGNDHGTDRHDQFHIHLFFCTCEMGHMINQTSQKKMTKRFNQNLLVDRAEKMPLHFILIAKGGTNCLEEPSLQEIFVCCWVCVMATRAKNVDCLLT